MPDTPFPLQELVSCPATGQAVSLREDWQYETDDGELMYPVICGTPIFQPNLADFLADEQIAIVRAMARWGESDEVRDWFHENFKRLEPVPSTATDSELEGEGYPGMWSVLPKPAFLEFEDDCSDDLINEVFAERYQKLALDLACGQGGMIQRMASTCVQVIGIENNFYLAALANKLLRSSVIETDVFDPSQGWQCIELSKPAISNAHVICGNLLQLPFHEPMFDWIHCGHVLDLVDEPDEVIHRILRILKPGGRLSISSPWDLDRAGHFADMMELLDHQFTTLKQQDSVPWIRWNHARRFVVHEDWYWIGKLE